MRWKVLIGLVAAALLTVSVLPVEASPDVRVRVMVDFGTGRVLWADVPVPAGGKAWNATVLAADGLGLNLEASWSEYGVFVTDIGDADPVWPDYWHFLVWGAEGWDVADLGAASLPVADALILGWSLSRDDPTWDYESPWPGPKPEATPDHPYPVAMFRYDLLGQGVAGSAGPDRAAVAWAFDTGSFEITGTPAFADGVAFLETWTGVVAVAEDGSLLWENPDVAGASSPALHGGLLYAGGRDGRLHALDRDDGREAWNVSLQEDPVFSGVTASPRIARGKAFLGTFNETGGNGTLYAIDLHTREVVWSRETSSVHLSSAAISGRTLVVGLMGRFQSGDLTSGPPFGILALDADTGEDAWFHPTLGPVASSPAIRDGVAYATTKAGELLAIGLDGVLLWNRTIGPSIASPAVSAGLVVVGDGLLPSGGSLRAFRPSGEAAWQVALSGPVSASPTIAGPLVYAATNEAEGTVVAVDLATGAVRWSLVPEPSEFILSSPVVYEGSLYIASDNGRLYRIDDASPGDGPVALGDLRVVSALTVGVAAGLVALVLWRIPRRRNHAP